ncbi:MAG: (2Fe-2S)-binding protein [Lawsonibacter sp.]|nr:(2Fe-2S)-binding protein [Lawsonibacter sp.]
MNRTECNLGEFVPDPDDDMIICRCEEITKGEIRRAIHLGLYTVAEIRRFTRASMGLCQGSTCSKAVEGILAAELNIPAAQITPMTARAPMRPSEIGVLGSGRGDETDESDS